MLRFHGKIASDLHYSFSWTQCPFREWSFGNPEEKVHLRVILRTSVWDWENFSYIYLLLLRSSAVNIGLFSLILSFLSVQPISACMANEDKMNAIKNCTEAQKGIDLIIAHGNTTQTNISPLYFVPAIEVDNVRLLEIYQLNLKLLKPPISVLQEFNQDDQDDLLYHFSRDFCKRYRAKYHKKLSNC